MNGWLLAVLPLACLAVVLDSCGPTSRLIDVLHKAGPSDGRPPTTPALLRRSRLPADTAVTVPSAIAAELLSGRDVSGALRAVAAEHEATPELAARLRHGAVVAAGGGDLPAALCGGSDGAGDAIGAALQVTAACCGSGTAAGLALADLLQAAASAARSHVSLQGLARAELAGARSTAVVLAGLPLGGLALGQLTGAHPLRVLLGTPWGAACLLAALALTAAGVLWTRAIAAGLRRAMT